VTKLQAELGDRATKEIEKQSGASWPRAAGRDLVAEASRTSNGIRVLATRVRRRRSEGAA
jgi:hypothetical protein